MDDAARVNMTKSNTSVRHRPIFLLAPARSYSTVSLALLAGHPDIYGFPEMGLFTADNVNGLLHPKVQQGPLWATVAKRTGILRAVADLHEGSQEESAIRRAKEWLEECSCWSPRQLMDHLLELADPRIGLEKSPETVGTEDALAACIGSYPDARFIHLTRHPVTAMRSMCVHWRDWAERSEKALVVNAATAWYMSHVRIIRKLAQLPPRQWVRVRAEDLLREPLTRLPPVLSWLGLPTEDAIIRQMTRTENWRFASTGPSGILYGGDPIFLRYPKLRPVQEPGEITFDETWGLLDEMRDRIMVVARHLGY